MATIPTFRCLINETTAEYVAEWLVAAMVDAIYESEGTYDAFIWSSTRNHPATFRVVKVTEGNQDVLSVHFVSLASDKVDVRFHEESTKAEQATSYVLSILSPAFELVGDPETNPFVENSESLTIPPLPEKLKGRPREIVELVHQRLTVSEIAERLNLQEESVRKRLSEARSVYGTAVVPYPTRKLNT